MKTRLTILLLLISIVGMGQEIKKNKDDIDLGLIIVHYSVGTDTVPSLRTWDKYLEWCNDSAMVKDIEIDWSKLKYGLSNISDGVDSTITRKWTGKYIKTINETEPSMAGMVVWIRKTSK